MTGVGDTSILRIIYVIVEITDFRGDLIDISAKTLAAISSRLFRAGKTATETVPETVLLTYIIYILTSMFCPLS